MQSSEIRRAYLDFFAARQHAVRPSAPLVPLGDPTLMFNSAGMVPFKPYFLGVKKDLSRAASCQKCFRTTDIDRVGTTLRHLTFFEMLGNFSFGDYFKEESIAWAWEFLTDKMALDPKRLHPSVFKDDEEAVKLWKKLGVPNAPVRLGEDSNFWNMGPTGPCGPCSEIYFDRGPQYSCGKTSCAAGCDCDRYLEIWNLVFTQFDRQEDGALKALPRRNIDTGMGLERLAFVAQGRPSPFDTDLFAPIVQVAGRILGAERHKSPENELAYRVIADHSRAAIMLLAEGVIPSNVERGYVLRRLIRRALRYGQLLGHGQAFLHRLVPAALEIFEGVYSELPAAAAQVEETLKSEEEKFLETLRSGEEELEGLLERAGKLLSGEEAFKLYDTFGFPLELTREISSKRGISVDEDGFKRAQEKAVAVARASWKGSGEVGVVFENFIVENLFSAPLQTEFTGYESLQEIAQVVGCAPCQPSGCHVLVLDKTPFYPEGGGQVGDEGGIFSPDGGQLLAEVLDTKKQGSGILHIIRPAGAKPPAAGEKVLATVDAARRSRVRPHHTATHLLNEALRRVLGSHVRQAGSYVGPDKLRFDFTFPKALDPETLQRLESMVVEEIRKGEIVATKMESVDKVHEYGAVTLLGEDYGERPRFVLIGSKGWETPKERFSLELCGGTHVGNTAEIGAFKIVRESSAAAGVRRIEALAGIAVEDYERAKAREEEESVSQLLKRERELLEEISALGGKADELAPDERAEPALRSREKELKELVARLKAKKLSAAALSGHQITQVKDTRLLSQRFDGADPKSLRSLSDKLKGEIGSGLVFIAAPGNGKLSFVLAATADLPPKGYDAAKIAKAFAAARGGSAGGRADFAQGGMADLDWEKTVSALAALILESLRSR
ncbi:MAG: alanine--tRNA ligase [Elusimicrobia bacterium]|nr:alanine--tRNA ligase [Elusimicrobiota bacterium]